MLTLFFYITLLRWNTNYNIADRTHLGYVERESDFHELRNGHEYSKCNPLYSQNKIQIAGFQDSWRNSLWRSYSTNSKGPFVSSIPLSIASQMRSWSFWNNDFLIVIDQRPSCNLTWSRHLKYYKSNRIRTTSSSRKRDLIENGKVSTDDKRRALLRFF